MSGAGKRLVAPVGLVLLVLSVFAAHLGNGFVWDDHGYLAQNPYVLGAVPWQDAFTHDVWFGTDAVGSRLPYYRPFFLIVCRFLWWLGNGSAFPFHLASLLLQLSNAGLAMAVFRRWGWSPGAAWSVAAVFLVHPLVGETVYWAGTLSEQLVLLALLAGLTTMSGTAWKRSETMPQFAALTALVALAITAKETGVVVPALLTAFLLMRRHEFATRWQTLAALWLPVPVILLARFWFLADVPLPAMAESGVDQVALAARILVWDFARLVWPWPLSPLHDLAAHDAMDRWWWIAAAGTLAAVSLYSAWRRPWQERLLWCWLWLPLLPPLSQVLLGRPTMFQVGERYLFLSLLPALALAAVGLRRAFAGPPPEVAARWLPIATQLALLTAMPWTFWYGYSFRSDETYFARVLEVYPQQALALDALAQAALRRGETGRALILADQSIQANPRMGISHLNRAVILDRLGRRAEAIQATRTALAADPRLGPAHANLARWLREAGAWNEAGEHYVRLAELQPDNAGAWLDLGSFRYTAGDPDGALAAWQNGLKQSPRSCPLIYNVALAAKARGDARQLNILGAQFLAACSEAFAPQREEVRRWLAAL